MSFCCCCNVCQRYVLFLANYKLDAKCFHPNIYIYVTSYVMDYITKSFVQYVDLRLSLLTQTHMQLFGRYIFLSILQFQINIGHIWDVYYTFYTHIISILFHLYVHYIHTFNVFDKLKHSIKVLSLRVFFLLFFKKQ